MRTTNTFGITFFLRKNRVKDGKAPIYFRITVDGQRIDLALKKDVEIENWNDAKGLAKGKSSDVRSLNTYLEQIRSRVVECYQTVYFNKKMLHFFSI